MIEWSRGLRQFLGLNELTDEEVAAMADEGRDVCGISPDVWSAMIASECENDALDAIERAGRKPGAALAAFLACLRHAGLDVEARDEPGGPVVRFRRARGT